MRQTGFSFLKNYKKEFGGSRLVGKKKARRPLSTKAPIHLVLKSSRTRAFRPDFFEMDNLIRKDAKKFGIKIYDLAINWSHIHLLIKIDSRESYIRFIRSVTSQLVAYLNRKLKRDLRGIFDLRPFTKILTWGRQFERALHYQILNNIEAIGGSRTRKRFENELKRLAMTPNFGF